MQVLANLFLLMFLADGCFSFLDGLLTLLSPVAAISGLRIIVANVVVLLAIAVYLCLGFDKRLPKRVFLPLILFVFMVPVLVWFLPALAGAGFGLLVAGAQVTLLLLVTAEFRKARGSIVLPKETFTGPSFSWKNTLTFGAVNTLVLPCVLVLFLLSSASSSMQSYTSGFMRLGPDGLHMAEKVYRRGDKTIRLAAMIHVGEKEYYEKILNGEASGRTIVLAEGVTDNRHLLNNRPDYGKFAGYLGLSSQQEKFHFKGRAIDAEQLEESKPSKAAAGKGAGMPDILRADVDISTFRPSTITFLDALGKQMQESPTLTTQLLSSVAWSQKNITPEMQKGILDDVLYRRNKVLIGYLKAAVDKYDTIIVPWGALHMAEIEAEVVKEGFKLQEVRDSVSIHFTKKGNRS